MNVKAYIFFLSAVQAYIFLRKAVKAYINNTDLPHAQWWNHSGTLQCKIPRRPLDCAQKGFNLNEVAATWSELLLTEGLSSCSGAIAVHVWNLLPLCLVSNPIQDEAPWNLGKGGEGFPFSVGLDEFLLAFQCSETFITSKEMLPGLVRDGSPNQTRQNVWLSVEKPVLVVTVPAWPFDVDGEGSIEWSWTNFRRTNVLDWRHNCTKFHFQFFPENLMFVFEWFLFEVTRCYLQICWFYDFRLSNAAFEVLLLWSTAHAQQQCIVGEGV